MRNVNLPAMQIPTVYLDLIQPLINEARRRLEIGERLAPMCFVGNLTSHQVVSIAIDTRSEDTKDRSAEDIQHAADTIEADVIFTIMEGRGLPKDKIARYQEALDRYGSLSACPWRIDVVSFTLETRHGTWGCSVGLKFKPPSKKRRMFAEAVNLVHVDQAEGRFAGLLPAEEGGTLH